MSSKKMIAFVEEKNRAFISGSFSFGKSGLLPDKK
jgi:hypothetical protein